MQHIVTFANFCVALQFFVFFSTITIIIIMIYFVDLKHYYY